LSEIAEIVGGGTPSTSDPEYWDGDIDWYTPAEIGEQIFVNGSLRKITKEGLNHCSAKILPADKTVLFTSRAGIGNMAILQSRGATNQGFQSLVCNDDIDPYFVFSMGEIIKAKVKRVAAGSTFSEISGKKLGDLSFMFPDGIEQEHIGAYFKNLDHLITLHQSKFFAGNSAKITDSMISWEQRKVGELTTELTEYATMNSKLPLFTSSRNGLMYQSECRGSLTTNSKKTMFSVVPLGACTYRHMSDDDIFHLNINTLEKGIVSREYPVFVATDKNDIRFIVQFINSSPTFLSFCTQQKKGGTRTRLYYKTLCDFKMMVPETTEQKKIANFFQGVDQVITLHQRKLKYMDQHRNWGDLYGSL